MAGGGWIRRRSRPWLPLWGSWHGVAVTERVPCSNLRIFLIFATACALSGSRSLASSPIGGAKGRALPAQRTEIFALQIQCHKPEHDHHPPSNRVTPYGVGLPPGSQTRIASRCNLPNRVTPNGVG